MLSCKYQAIVQTSADLFFKKRKIHLLQVFLYKNHAWSHD